MVSDCYCPCHCSKYNLFIISIVPLAVKKNKNGENTYIRYDGGSQSSFPQTLPVKTFKPPEIRERGYVDAEVETDGCLRVSSLTCASGCLSHHFSGFQVSLMDYPCQHKRHASEIYSEDGHDESGLRHTVPPTCRAS